VLLEISSTESFPKTDTVGLASAKAASCLNLQSALVLLVKIL
jgi:hypothetical protein